MRDYEVFNDVQLLNERLHAAGGLGTVLEVGCATGEFFRYLSLKWPKITYVGTDISRPAIERALDKYPHGNFVVSEADDTGDLVNLVGLKHRPDVLYCKDVVLHQTDPFGFIRGLLGITTQSLIMRLRTRDLGATVLDPDSSCQYHYDGWMPYIVINTDELIDAIRAASPGAELIVRKHHVVLGGLHSRNLPKDCYLSETGTAETAVEVFLGTDRPGHVTVENRRERSPSYTLPHLLSAALRRARLVLTDR